MFRPLILAGVVFATAAPIASVAATTATPSPAPSASAQPAAGEPSDAAVEARAKEWLHRLQTADMDRSQVTPSVAAQMTPATLKSLQAEFGPLGDPTAFDYLGQQSVGEGLTAYVYRVTFKTKTYEELFVLDQAGKVAGIQLPPAP